MTELDRFEGTLLGEACGDALGFPMKKLSVTRIQHRFGPFGLITLIGDPKNDKKALVSDNTQMMLAASDGILWADAKKLDLTEGIYRGLMRWFYSQTGEEPRRGQRTWMRRQSHEHEFCLIREKFMHARRDPEEGILAALGSPAKGTVKNKVNDSKGSGALSRAIPIGLLYSGDPEKAFEKSVEAAALTHSDPMAYYAAGAFGALIAGLAAGLSMPKALEKTARLFKSTKKMDPIEKILEKAVKKANDFPAGSSEPWSRLKDLKSLGTGETAPEALAMAVYCVVSEDDPMAAVIHAANQDGLSHTVAAVTGAIEGARFGASAFPDYWTDMLECRSVIHEISDLLYHVYKKENPSAK
jgi:ADP-ribosylglycohydrolase